MFVLKREIVLERGKSSLLGFDFTSLYKIIFYNLSLFCGSWQKIWAIENSQHSRQHERHVGIGSSSTEITLCRETKMDASLQRVGILAEDCVNLEAISFIPGSK